MMLNRRRVASDCQNQQTTSTAPVSPCQVPWQQRHLAHRREKNKKCEEKKKNKQNPHVSSEKHAEFAGYTCVSTPRL